MTKFLLTFLAIYFFYKYITKPVYITPPREKESKTKTTASEKRKNEDYIDYEEIK
jgi:hypothetical protein